MEPVQVEEEAKMVEDLKIEEKRRNMNPKHLELFSAIEKGNLDAVKKLIEVDKVPIDISDENDMSPLLQASYRGFTDIMKFILSKGADVNVTCHTNFYTPLMMAAISGKTEATRILLDAGANIHTTNSIGKTAKDLSSFVGQHEISALIRNYLTLERLEPYFTPQGDNPPRISKKVASLLQNLVMSSTFHPVQVVIAVMENEELNDISALKKCSHVLDDLGRKCVRSDKDFDEILTLKCHEMSTILSLCRERKMKEKSDLTTFIKMLLKENEAGIQIGSEKLIRDSLLKFPFTNLPVLLQLVQTLSKTKLEDAVWFINHIGMPPGQALDELLTTHLNSASLWLVHMFWEILFTKYTVGEDPTALTCLQTVFNGMQSMQGSESWCETCWERNAPLQCSACKKVRYCSQRCQKLQWFVHKKTCSKKC